MSTTPAVPPEVSRAIQRIINRMTRHTISQAELSRGMEIDESQVSRWFHGRSGLRTSSVERIEDAIDAILEQRKHKPRRP